MFISWVVKQHKNNPHLNTETVRHSFTYIIIYEWYETMTLELDIGHIEG